ncbi:hypothetical protein F5Y17DRAFT_431319 [Xylariaceae sp. FL0594]|nr:hypothetical protein F5Y17DRAFT_431319 [Xylariaceae sp. FL0594]
MNSPNTPNHDRLLSTSLTNTGRGATYRTALKGASLAFQKGVPNRSNGLSTSAPVWHMTNGIGNAHVNDALIAATSVSRDDSLSRSPSKNPLPAAGVISSQSTGRSNIVAHNVQPATGQGHLLAPRRTTAVDPRSPSFIAATLAASRSTSPSPKVAPASNSYPHQSTARKLPITNPGNNDGDESVADFDLSTDTSSIGPTNSLISLFERKVEEVGPVKKSPSIPKNGLGTRNGLRTLTPSKPTEPVVSLDTSPSQGAADFDSMPQLQSKRVDTRSRKQPPTPPPGRTKRGTKLPEPGTPSKAERKSRPVAPPPKGSSRSPPVIISPQPKNVSSPKIVQGEADRTLRSKDRSLAETSSLRQTLPPRAAARPTTPGANVKDPGLLLRRSSTSLSTDTFVSAPSTPSARPASPRYNSLTPNMDKLKPSPAPTHSPSPALRNVGLTSPRRPALQVPGQSPSPMGLESLTNAIVAGSLASARAPPRVAKPPTPPPRRQTPHMRHTLRAPRAKSEEEEALSRPQGKKPFVKLSSGKKHSHHEGTRKRWREEITAHERQRYEGVWASNRGLLLDEMSAAANGLGDVETSMLVANVVVRDLWSRSRLPFDELAEVWDLVDGRGKGVLDKAEFVVGMWLIDQRLRGRKIPHKVSDSVWGSAKGVRILGPQGKKKKK